MTSNGVLLGRFLTAIVNRKGYGAGDRTAGQCDQGKFRALNLKLGK